MSKLESLEKELESKLSDSDLKRVIKYGEIKFKTNPLKQKFYKSVLNGDFHIQNLLSEDSIGEIISLMKTGEISKEDALTYLNPNDPKIKSLLKSKYKHYGL